ncbi:BLUF domain-containing protein [Aureimonas jatrophae]|uniref:Sensors of blue-light using FAD n=1 Tax=Aureimonas jatrophae TaxID=1166073 RepID=A0A1H0EQW2_9HYPH|nr:BLUF domain-containing protein [Aureimonas jatrophae]MBB3950364.1 hypothetical protein [Aureimonas jatrophae]SDN84683.1 Sensors of blue-light using FAD [Aureimonas jatrophae]
MTLLHLSYVSRLAPETSMADLLDQIGHFRAKNLAAGVSGCIAFEGDRIMQILEGPEAAVNELFRIICNDPRHVEVIELERKPIEAVSFRDWGMVRRPIADVVFLSQLT